MVCEAASACLSPCRAEPVALEEATVRGRIGADVVFGDQKHKLASLKNVSIIRNQILVIGMWFQRFIILQVSEEIRSHDYGIVSVHGVVWSVVTGCVPIGLEGTIGEIPSVASGVEELSVSAGL